MALKLKRTPVLSREDLRTALDSLSISVSQVAKETGLPRNYVSEFLSIGRPLKPEQLRSIRDYMEEQGVEFDDATPDANGDALHPSLAIANICHFPIRLERVHETRVVLDEIELNDKRIAELLDEDANRGSTMFYIGEGEFTEQTETDIRELFALAGANYFLMRYLTGVKNPFEQAETKKTIRSVVVETIKDSLNKAGIKVAAEANDEAHVDEEATV